jgi:non-specific serine/threonine protein kinase
LVDKSLVRLNTAGRYELHELLRQFAADKLQEANETAETQQRHFQYFLSLAEQLDRYYFGPQNVVWMDRLETELDNNRVALDWVSQSGDAYSGLRLAGALGWFWIRREYWKEGREWLEKFRASSMDIPIAVRAKAHHYAMELGESLGDHAYTTGLCEEGFRLAHEVEDRRLTAWLLLSLGAFGRCPDVSVEGCLEEALALFRKLGDRWGICESLSRLGHTLVRRGDLIRGRELEEEGIRLARQSGDKSVLSWLVFVSAVRNLIEGGSEQQTESLYRESLAMFQELRCKGGIAAALINVAGCAYRRGDDEQAKALFQSSLMVSQQIGDKDLAVFTLLRLGDIFCRNGESQRGARLLGLVGDLLPSVDYGSSQKEKDGRMSGYNSGLAAAHTELGEEDFAAAFAEGQRMTLDQAIAYALANVTVKPLPIDGN